MSLADDLVASVVRPVFIGWLDFATAPLYGWTGVGAFLPLGTGDPDLDGNTFPEAGAAVSISDFEQDTGIGGPLTIDFSAGEMDDEDVFQQLIVDRSAYLGRRAKIWLGFMNSDESAVLSDFEILFYGVMTSARTKRQTGQPSLISVTCDQDLQKARTSPIRWIDHQFFYPSDTASSFINDLSRGPISSSQRLPGQPAFGDPAQSYLYHFPIPPGG